MGRQVRAMAPANTASVFGCRRYRLSHCPNRHVAVTGDLFSSPVVCVIATEYFCGGGNGCTGPCCPSHAAGSPVRKDRMGDGPCDRSIYSLEHGFNSPAALSRLGRFDLCFVSCLPE